MTGAQEFLAVDVHPGGKTVEAALGLAAVLVVVGLTFDGTLRIALMAAGCAGALARAVWFTGPHYLWFDGETLVEQRNRRKARFALTDVTSAEANLVPKKGTVLHLHGGSGDSITVWNLTEDTEAFRHELGRRLRACNHPALARAGLSTLKSLGLD